MSVIHRKRAELPKPGDSTVRVLSAEEATSIARDWELSPDCAELQERQKNLKEKIDQKSSIYSNRC